MHYRMLIRVFIIVSFTSAIRVSIGGAIVVRLDQMLKLGWSWHLEHLVI